MSADFFTFLQNLPPPQMDRDLNIVRKPILELPHDLRKDIRLKIF